MKGYVILIAAVAALGGLLFGFDTAVIAGTLRYLTHYFSLSNSALGLIVAAASIGCIPGALVAGRLADRYGRKIMLIVTSLLYIVAALGSGVAFNFTELLIYRLMGGVAIGMASALAPVYISEIAPPAARGRLGMLQQLAIVTGILVSFISNYLIVNSKLSFLNDDNYWRYMLAAAVIPSLVFFVLLLLVPESPRWLVTQGKLGPAERIFEKIYGGRTSGMGSGAASDLAQAQVQAIRADLQAGPAAPLREVLSPRYRRTVLIGLAFAAVAQLTGINIVFYYAPLIFEKTRMGGSVLYQTLLTGIVNLVFTIVAFWLIDRLGRKKLLLMGSWVMGLCMLVLGVLFLEGRLGNYLVLGCIFVYIGGFACSWGAVLWVYVAEIFPNRIRGTATSIAVFGNWVANSIVSFTFPLLLSGIGPAATFFIYAFINLGMLFFVHRYVFETKGVALEKIEELYATV